ncbi:MAG: hypothetical protein IJ503_08905 [Akkermansia sp.]|nr:hypothetical protein [Akkermansia sp.]
MENLPPRDAARAAAALQAGEELLLVVKPRSAPGADLYFQMLPGALMVAVPVGVMWTLQELGWVPIFIGMPFLLLGLTALSSPWRYRWRMQRTLYLLTNHRAIVLEPRRFRMRVRAFALHPDLVKQVVAEPAGHGDIIFARERRWQFGARSIYYGLSPVGFLAVPQVQRVAQMIAELTDSILPSAEPTTASQVPVRTVQNPVQSMIFGAVFILVTTAVAVAGGWCFVADVLTNGLSVDILPGLIIVLGGGFMSLVGWYILLDAIKEKNKKN